MKKKVITIIITCIVCALVFLLINLALIIRQYYTAQRAYEELNSAVVEENHDEETISDIPIDVDFNALKEINEDIVAWIYVEAVNISYPVLYSGDNDYYLRRGYDGEYLISGSIFIEGKNNPDFLDPHTVIYGHNMKDGSMFSSLEELYTKSYIENDDTFWVITETYAYQYQIFSLNYTLSTSDVYKIFYEQDDKVTKYIENRATDSLLDLSVPAYDQNSKIVTLSTCGPLSGTQRFVVQGILIRALETT